MPKNIFIACDGIDCGKMITSREHAGTWITVTVKRGNAFDKKDYCIKVTEFSYYFCSDGCLKSFEW